MKKIFVGCGCFPLIAITVVISIVVIVALMAPGNTKEEDNEEQQTTLCQPGAGADNIPEEYRSLVQQAAEIAEIDPSIIAAQIDAESSWDPNANSGAGAKGISQFLDNTWAEFGEGGDVYDPADAIPAQGRYMKWIKDFLENNGFKKADNLLELTLAGYNAGVGAVVEAGGIPQNEETQNYVVIIPDLAQTKYKGACQQPDGETIPIDFDETGKWAQPLPGGIFTSGYGPRGCVAGAACTEDVRVHQGIDLSTGGGGKVSAPADMEVTFADNSDYWAQWYGTWIIGKQIGGEGYIFEFHHCQTGSLKVKKGQKVKAGTQLCTEGSTGNAPRPHLHFQVGKPGIDPTQPTRRKTIDPKPILIAKGVL